MAALAALKEKLPKQEEETPSSKYAGKKLSAKEQMEAALDLESDEEEKKVMKQLVDVQGKVDEIISAYAKERAEMSARFQTQLLEVYSQRQALIKTGTATPVASGGDSASTSQSGEHAAAGATGGSGTGIHNFWLDVLKNCGATKMAIEEHDEPVLEYLTDIAWQPMENNEGFQLTFHFAPNPYFSNGVLTKSYPIKNMYDPMNNYDFQWKEVQGSEINWAAGKDVTVEMVKPKRRGGRKGGKQQAPREEPRESFFHFFNCEDVDEEEIKDMNPMERQQYEQAVDSDFRVGCAIKDKVIPYAQKFYVGDPTGEDDDFEGSDDEDEDWDGEGEGMDMRMLQAMLGGGQLTPEMMAAMAGDDDDEEDDEGAVFGKKNKSSFAAQLDEEDEEESEDEEEDEEAAAAIRAAISGAFGGAAPEGGSLGAGLQGGEQGDDEKPKDCKQQ